MSIKKINGLDLRSIALFRLLLGLFVAGEFLFSVLPSFTDIYSPETGVMGNCFAKGYMEQYNVSSFVFNISSDSGMYLFIGITTLVALLFAIGFYSRISALVLAILLFYFHSRYNLLFFGWEMYSVVLVFLSIFLPSSAHLSIFNYGNSKIGSNEFRSPIAFAVLFQIALIYFYNGISKNGDKWLNGTAVQFFIAEMDKARPAAEWLANQPGLCTALTWMTLAMEISILLLIFSPFRNNITRTVASLFIIALHWGIDIFADVGYFKYVATCGAVIILPGCMWDALKKSASSIYQTVFDKVNFRFNVPAIPNLSNKYMETGIAFMLVFIMLFSNLYNTSASKTNDRIKLLLQASGVEKSIKNVGWNMMPQASFFAQYWHFYSPNPPSEKGYMQLELITENKDTISVFRGIALTDKLFSNNLQKRLFSYLTIKQNRNKKEKVLTHCMLMDEISFWNKKKMAYG